MAIKAGALQPARVRQLTTPPPCLPATIIPAFGKFGITATHRALASTEEGIWWDDVMLRIAPAAPSNSFAASAASAAVANNTSVSETSTVFIKTGSCCFGQIGRASCRERG